MSVPTDAFKMLPKEEYEFVQVNGQLKYGPPKGWSGPPPPKGCEIFIGKVPSDISENELLQLFKRIGPIYEFRVMINFSNANKGFAFATYTNKDDAREAISKLDGYKIRPYHKLGVLMSKDNRKLYIGGIPVDKSEDDVYHEIIRYTQGVTKVCVLPNSYDHRKNRGFAFVEYESHRHVSIARRVLLSGNVKLFNRKVTVDWADPEPEIDEECLKETTTLYVRNVPLQIDESHLKSVFSSNGLGPVRKIKKLKDFAFVHYFVKKDAEKALNQLNGTKLNERVLEVTWAKPRVQAIEGSSTILKKSKIRKDMEEWNVSQERSKHVMPPTFIPTVNSIRRTPMQMLEHVCLRSGFGEPYYLTYQSASSKIPTFTSKVFIPYLPLWENGFVSNGAFHSPFEAKCFAALKALENIGFSDIDCHFPRDQFIPAIKYPSRPSIASISNSCSPIGMNIGQESRHYHELVKAPSPYSDLWNFQKDEIVSSKKSDSVSSCDLLAAAIVAYREMQACSSKQN